MAANGQFDVIVHGCNCQHTMGAGIAKQIKVRFPEAFDADRASPLGNAKLGTISYAVIQLPRQQLFVVNGYTQATWRGAGVKVDYGALRSVMRHVKSNFSGKRIGYPKLGAGLAGGDWSVIEKIIDDELAEEDHALVEYKP